MNNIIRKLKQSKIKTSYIIGISIMSLILLIVGFSYAIFTINVEKSGALNIITANLYYKIEASQLDGNNQITLEPFSTKEIKIKVINLNSVKTSYNVWYQATNNNVEVLYNPVNDSSSGELIDAYTSSNNSKLINVSISNNNSVATTFTIGITGGIYSKPLNIENTQLAIKVMPKLNEAVIANLGTTGTTYKASDGSTYIRGESNKVNNYIWYSGMMWRIYRINPDGSVKVITDDNVSSLSFHATSNVYEMSYIKEWLNSYFWDRLNFSKTSVLKQDNEFCIDGTNSLNFKREECTSKISNQKIGLLTVDEYNIVKNGENTNYLNSDLLYFTMTPYLTAEASIWHINNIGNESGSDDGVKTIYGVRPVTVINRNINIASGNGSMLNPYKIADDTKPIASGLKLNMGHSGELINYDNKLWRIIEISNNLTKVVYDSVISPISGTFGVNNLDWDTTKGRLESIGINTSKLALNEIWQRSYMAYGNNVLTTSLANGNEVISTFGLLKVGEMWSNQNNQKTTNYAKYVKNNYWTMTPDSSNAMFEWQIMIIGYSGNGSVINSYGIRPCFFFKEDITIKSGQGTPNNPYTLN